MANDYTQRWYSLFAATIPAEQTAREVEFLQRQLPMGRFRRVLDVCCGTGRYALPLAALGYEVLGTDASDFAIEQARRSGSSATFRQCDMRELRTLPGAHDAVTCLWQSFGYFDDSTNLDVLRQVRERLRPGGRLVLDVYHRSFFRSLPLKDEGARDGESFETIRSWRGPRMRVTVRYASGRSDEFDWRLYDPEELGDVAEQAGLTALVTCTDFSEETAASPKSPRIQLLAERPA